MSWFKHKVIHQKIKDVFFDSHRKLISLVYKDEQKQKWIFDLSLEHIKSILRHDYAYICYGALIVASLVIIFYSDRVKAQAIFYPTSCLGGWTNTGKATGPADLADESDGALFNTENSAILKNTNAEIYCGSFTGDVPKETEPKKFYLSFSWAIDDGTIIHPEPQPFTPINEDVPASEAVPAEEKQGTESVGVSPDQNQIPDQNSGQNQGSTPAPTQDQKNSPPAPSEESPQSFLWDNFVNTAYAQNPLSPDIEVPTPAPVPTPTLDSTSSPQVAPETTSPPAPLLNQGGDVSSPTSVGGALNDITNLLDKTKAEIIPTENKPQNFLFISYTLDGTTWLSLGEVNSSNWQGARFTIPLSSWDDVSKMQVSMKTIQTIDKMPAVYLDAMRIDVEYESIIGIVTPSAYHTTSMVSNTEGFSISLGGHPPEREDVLVSNTVDPISGLAVYDTASGVLRLNTYINGPSYYLDAEYFGAGDFTAISTKDENICSDKNLADCLSSPDTEGSGTFSIAPK